MSGCRPVFTDEELVEGLAAVQALKGAVAALEARLLAEVDLVTWPASSCTGARPPTGTPTSPA